MLAERVIEDGFSFSVADGRDAVLRFHPGMVASREK
jgi:hypothetical protein